MLKRLVYASLLVLGVTACGSNHSASLDKETSSNVGGTVNNSSNNVSEKKNDTLGESVDNASKEKNIPDEQPLVGEVSNQKNYSSSLDYRRNYKDILASKSVIAIQAIKGPQAGSPSGGNREMTLSLNGHVYDMTDRIDVTALPDGLLERQYDAKGKELAVTFNETKVVDTHEKGTMYIYQQPYSMVLATLPTSYEYDGKSDPKDRLGKANTFQVQLISGLPTSKDTIDKLTDTVVYKGKAFTDVGQGKETGDLEYSIDFSNKKGKGTITGIESTGKINLAEGRIGIGAKFNPLSTSGSEKGISGSATAEKMDAYYYNLSIYGPKADEVAGYVYGRKQGKEGNWNVGFAGEKQQ